MRSYTGGLSVIKLFKGPVEYNTGYLAHFACELILEAPDGDQSLRGFHDALVVQADVSDYVLERSALLDAWYEAEPLTVINHDDRMVHYLLLSDDTWLNLIAPPRIEPEWFNPAENEHLLEEFGVRLNGRVI